MKVDEGGVDVLPGLGKHTMEPVQSFAGYPGQDSAALVQMGGGCFKVAESRFGDSFGL